MARCFSLFFLFSVSVFVSAAAACPASDRAALLALRSALSEPYLGIFSSWTGHDCCSRWYGVSCDPTNGRIADITLRGESEDPILSRAGRSGGLMSSHISSEICRLDRLTTLVLANWKQISGSIPPASPPSPSSASSTSSATASPGPSPPTLAASPASPSSTLPTTTSPAYIHDFNNLSQEDCIALRNRLLSELNSELTELALRHTYLTG